MSPVSVGIIGVIVLFVLMLAGMPIGFAMALVGFVGFAVLGGLPGALVQLATSPFSSVAVYVMSVLPLFVFMGELAFAAGLVRKCYDSMYKWLGNLPGGLAIATIAGCAAFGAVCGSTAASTTTMTLIAHPEMRRFKYDQKLSLGSIAVGGTLASLITPSVPMIIYSLFSETSVGRLFIGGIIPGVILSLLFVIVIFFWSKLIPSAGPRGPKFTWHEKFSSLGSIWPIMILALFILGGLWGGVFSPTEAGGAGAFGALIIGIVTKGLSVKSVISSLSNTIKTTTMIFTIIIGAIIFTYFVSLTELPLALTEFVENLNLPPIGVLVVILFIYVILGSLMDTMAMTVVTLPIFVPVLDAMGFDLVWFGIIFIIMCEMAVVTPPIGMNVFMISGIVTDVPMANIFKGIVPFLLSIIVCVVILTAWPQIVLILPNLMIG